MRGKQVALDEFVDFYKLIDSFFVIRFSVILQWANTAFCHMQQFSAVAAKVELKSRKILSNSPSHT